MSKNPEQPTTPPRHARAERAVDRKYPFPSPYISFNPEFFDDSNWKLRDLQKLCQTLNLKIQLFNEGTLSPRSKQAVRDDYIQKLRQWHKTPIRQSNPKHIRRKGTTNFSLLQVEVPLDGPVPTETASAMHHNPKLLTPLKNKPRMAKDGAPIGILRQDGARYSPARKLAIQHGSVTSPSDPIHQERRIQMSIFNGTKIIPPKPAIFDDWLGEAGITYDTDSDSDSFVSPTKERIEKLYAQNQQFMATPTPSQQQQQQQQQPVTPSVQSTSSSGQSTSSSTQNPKSISFQSPATSDAGSTPMKPSRLRQPTPAVPKSQQASIEEDEGEYDPLDDLNEWDELNNGQSPAPSKAPSQATQSQKSHATEIDPFELPEDEFQDCEEMPDRQFQSHQQPLPHQQQQPQQNRPITRRQSFISQQQQQQNQPTAMPQQSPARVRPLTRSDYLTRQNQQPQQTQSQFALPTAPRVTKQQSTTYTGRTLRSSIRTQTDDATEQELMNGVNSLSL